MDEKEMADDRLYRAIVESMGEAAVVVRKSDGRILYGNERFAEWSAASRRASWG